MKELSAEIRALLAAVLSLLIIVVWTMVYKPQPPPKPPAQTSPAQPTPGPATGAPAATITAAAATLPTFGARAATKEETLAIENGLYRVEFSNRGAVVRSWQLKRYQDDAKPPRTLDLVNPVAAQQTGGWPFSLVLDDASREAAINSALFIWELPGSPTCPDAKPGTPAVATTSQGGVTLQVPAEVCFAWSDGHLEVTKRLKFDRSYMVRMETSVRLDGQPLAHGMAWRGGFGDTTVYMPAEHVQVFASAAGKLQTLPYKKLGEPNQQAVRVRMPGAMDYGGIEDQYFAAAFLPPAAAGAPGGLVVWHWKLEREVAQEGKTTKEPVAEMAVGTTTRGSLALRVYVGPKALDEMKSITPPLTELIQFGWMEFIAAPLFYLLKWLHRYVPNYGWAIILMTILINMVLFPLKVKSWRSMQKMQKVAPEIKAIQEKYKKYSLRDPRKAQMNQEVMAVYQREGINPMGGCLPMVIQMPIWFGLYRMLTVAIELRHAPWLGWIRDLSARDPFYVLPILMAVTMYIMQKMTPTTVTDPTQQRMFTMMPLIFGGMFVIFPVSSGLVLYILTSNLIGMAQQWYLNRTAPADTARGKGGRKK